MAARFVEISLEDMDKFLKRSFRALRPKKSQKRGEVYYDLKLGPFVGIRVWTSIGPHADVGADVGADAIRVQFVSLKDEGPLEKGKAPIVKRTQNWRDNLKDRIADLVEKYDDNEGFWEGWAETRQRQGDPKREMKRQEEEREEDKQERELLKKEEQEEREMERQEKQYDDLRDQDRGYQREVPLEKLRGDISSKQIGYIRFLLRGVDHKVWGELELSELTGFSHIPNREQLQTMSKRDASQLIDALLKAGYGKRYASEDEFSDEFSEEF